MSCWWYVLQTATWTKVWCNCEHTPSILVFFFHSICSWQKIVFNKKDNTLFCNNCRAASTSCTAALTSAATWSTKTLSTSFTNSNVCYIKQDFVVVRNLTCGEQAHMESAGTNSSTSFQSVTCKDTRVSKLHSLWDVCSSESVSVLVSYWGSWRPTSYPILHWLIKQGTHWTGQTLINTYGKVWVWNSPNLTPMSLEQCKRAEHQM